jgi:lactate dehydrogenase-like 2-hydroxyacid dehydrogenase
MRIYFVGSEQSDHEIFAEALQDHELHFVSELEDVEIDAEILSIFIESIIDAYFLDQHQQIKLIVTRSTGHDHIDISECEKRSIIVCFVPSYGDNTVAQHTFALILALSRRNREAREACREGRFTYEVTRGFDLNGKTLGMIGTGKIGLRVIRPATAFEMEVVAYDIHRQSSLEEVLGFRYVSLDQLTRVLAYHFSARASDSDNLSPPGSREIQQMPVRRPDHQHRAGPLDRHGFVDRGARSGNRGWSRAGCDRGRTHHVSAMVHGCGPGDH